MSLTKTSHSEGLQYCLAINQNEKNMPEITEQNHDITNVLAKT
jgi:hypothetical protein